MRPNPPARAQSVFPPAPSEPGVAELVWHGERLVLRCDRTVWWPAAKTLIVADPHFGKAATFRAAGVPVPAGPTEGNLNRLAGALDATGASRLLFLGDLFHSSRGISGALLAALGVWCGARPGLEVLNVRGNHDRQAGDPPAGVGIVCVTGPWFDAARPGLSFVHDPKEADGGRPTLAGHLHPAVVLRGPGRSRMRCACFHFATRRAVLPAFGVFTGMSPVRPKPGDRTFAVGPDAVVEFGSG